MSTGGNFDATEMSNAVKQGSIPVEDKGSAANNTVQHCSISTESNTMKKIVLYKMF